MKIALDYTEIGHTLDSIRGGRAAAEKRLAAIRADVVRRSSAPVPPEVIEQIGGKKLVRLRDAASVAATELSSVMRDKDRLGWLGRLPFGKVVVERLYSDRLSSATDAADLAAGALGDFEARIVGLIAKRARLAAVSMCREEREALGLAIERIDYLVSRLEAMKADGTTHLAIEPASRARAGWYRRLSELVAPVSGKPKAEIVASPIADGRDHSDKDLSSRSRVIPVPYLGPSSERKPWMGMPVDTRYCLAEANRLQGGLAGFRLNGSSFPPDLYGVRRRSGIPKLPGSLMKDDRVHLPVDLSEVGEVTAAGGVLSSRNTFHFDPGRVSVDGPISRFLPFVAQRWFRPLPVELIPRSSWGASLANLLTPATWNEIRKRATVPYGGRCWICGELRNGQAIECHEVWEYDEAIRYGDMAVQRLVGLFSVCKPCHGVFHQGFSRMRGYGDQAGYRLADINGWSMAELEIAETRMSTDYARRSKLKWALDLSFVASGKPLVVDKGKWADTGHGILRSDAGESSTALLGVAYRIGSRGELASPVTPPRA